MMALPLIGLITPIPYLHTFKEQYINHTTIQNYLLDQDLMSHYGNFMLFEIDQDPSIVILLGFRTTNHRGFAFELL